MIVIDSITSLERLSGGKIIRIPAERVLADDAGERLYSSSGTAIKFLCDTSLSRLARWLRMLGVDTEIFEPTTALKKQLGVTDMLSMARDENRIVLTGRKDLDGRVVDVPVMYLSSRQVHEQFELVTQHFGIPLEAKESNMKSAMMGRCSKCNGDEIVVIPAELAREAAMRGEFPEKLLDDGIIQEWWQCRKCSHIYWEGERFRLTKSSFLEVYETVRAKNQVIT